MTTGNANLDEKLSNPPKSPTPAEKAREVQEAQAKALEVDPDGPESDPRALLPGITTALEGLGMFVPGAGRVHIVFSFTPSITDVEEPTWVVSAGVDVYGEIIEQLDQNDPDVTLDVEDDVLDSFEVEGKPHVRIGDATLSLQKHVEDLVTKEAAKRRESATLLDKALVYMRQQSNLKAFWRGTKEEAEPHESL